MKTLSAFNAAPIPTGETGANNFLGSTLGGVVIAFCGAVGIIVAVVCILGMVKHVSKGKMGEGFKILIFGLVVGGLLFNLNFTIEGTKYMSKLALQVFDSITSLGAL